MSEKIKYKKIYYISIVLFVLAFWFSMVKIDIVQKISPVLFILFYLFILLGTFLYYKTKKYIENEVIQLTVVFLVLALFLNVNFIICERIDKFTGFISLFSINVSLLLCVIILCRIYDKRIIHRLKNCIMENKELLAVLLVFCGIYFINYDMWITWDNAAYYSSIMKMKGKWDFTLSTIDVFQMGGHTTYAYAFLLSIGEAVATNGIGVRFVNEIISVMTIICFYKIVIKLLKANYKIAALCTACFAFSPLFLGISYTINSDFPLLCYFVIFVYASLYNKKIWKAIMILAICYTKELGAFILLAYYIGECVVYAVKEKSIKSFFWFATEIDRFIMYFGIFMYYETILFGESGWVDNLRAWVRKATENVNTSSLASNTNTTLPEVNPISGIDFAKIKLFESWCMNFNWVLLVVVVIGVFIVIRQCIRDNKNAKEKIYNCILKTEFVPIFLSYLMFMMLSVIYKTMEHYRYIQFGHFFTILVFGYVLCLVFKSSKVKYLSGILTVILFLVQCFWTVDPITKLFLPSFDAGNYSVSSTRQVLCYNDSVWYKACEEEIAANGMLEGLDYNYQKKGIQKIFEKTLRDINYDKSKLIVINNFGVNKDVTFASLFGLSSNSNYYYNTKTGRIDMDCTLHETVFNEKSGDKSKYIDMINIKCDTDEIDESLYDEVYYLDVGFNKYYKSDFLNNHNLVKKFRENYGVWGFTVYRVK